MEGIAYVFAIVALVLSINAQANVRKLKRRVGDLEEPEKQKKRENKLIAAAEMRNAIENNKKG